MTRKLQYQYSKKELRKLIHCFDEDVGKVSEDFPDEVELWDETLRDGEQTPGISLRSQDKIEIGKKLNQIGVAKFAAGFPAVSAQELESVKKIKALDFEDTTVLGIARPKESDIDACLQCDLDEIVLFMPISDLMMKLLHETPESELEKIERAFLYAKEHGLRFNWVSEDCTRARPEHIIDVFKLAMIHSAESLIIGDTVGVLQPHTTTHLMNLIKKKLNWTKDKIPIGIHTHNDFGLAVSNTLVAVYNGATLPHVCVNGYGERAGNAAFEEVVVNLERMDINTGIDLEQIMELSKLTEEKFKLPVSSHKAIVGDNAFSHESGLHINAIIAHPMSYEPINPSKVGQTRRLYLGKFSGSGSIVNALKTKLKTSDINLPDNVIKKIVTDVKKKGEERSKTDKKEIYDKLMKLKEGLREGISDTEFFNIVEKHASEYLKGTWANPSKDIKE